MKLLVAADGSDRLRDDTLPAIAALAGEATAEVYVLHVIRAATEAWSDEELRHLIAERQHRMEELVADADFAVQVLVEPLPYGGEIPHYIALRAGDLQVNGVVVASKRSTGFMGGLLGSTARGLLRDSPVPVIVIRPRSEGGSDESPPPDDED